MTELGTGNVAQQIKRLSELLDALDRKLDDALLGIEVINRKIETLQQRRDPDEAARSVPGP